MRCTVERIDGVMFFKVNGVTRFIYMPRRGRESGIARSGTTIAIGLLGWCVVISPFRPKEAH